MGRKYKFKEKNSKEKMVLYKFYRIVNNQNDECYIGCTKQKLCKRYGNHREKRNRCTSKILFDKYGVENCKCILIKELELNSKEEASREERKIIEENKGKCVNFMIPSRTCKEYYQEHKDEIKENKKVYYENNKENFSIKFKKYREEHKDEISINLKEKIKCDLCNKEISLRNLSRHKNEQHKGIVRIR